MNKRTTEHIGKCALCGEELKLTFEHIPPQKAFNNSPVKTVRGNVYYDNLQRGADAKPFSRLKYDNDQKGKGLFSLCEKCNNNTGGWYGEAYTLFAKNVEHLLRSLGAPSCGSILEIDNATLKPLNVIKQVASMFCSINHDCESEKLDVLKAFVLDRNSHQIGDVGIGMFLLNGDYERFGRFSVKGNANEAGETSHFSEIVAFPLSFVLVSHRTMCYPYSVVDITDFSSFGYDEVATLKIGIPIHKTIGLTPGIIE